MLEVRNLKVHYGGIAAVKGISFAVPAGKKFDCLYAAAKASLTKAISSQRARPCSR